MSELGQRARMPVRLLLGALLWLVLALSPVVAAERLQLHATAETGYARLVLQFLDRKDLPPYRVTFDNGVLAITFDTPVAMTMPDMAATLPDYLTIGRLDADGKGMRFGLRTAFTVHSMEADEMLFVDVMPTTWQGQPPSLPPEIVAAVAQRAKEEAIRAEQERKAAEAKALNPTPVVKVGRNPTFVRLQFDWSVGTKAEFKQDGTIATIGFDWPVPIDLYVLKADMPPQILGVSNAVSAAGSSVVLNLAPGVTPRFYGEQGTSFMLDIDLTPQAVAENQTTAEELAKQAEAEASKASEASAAEAAPAAAADAGAMGAAYVPGEAITPTVDDQSGTVRVKFPFERDTPSAVFRRGDTLWMLFDTLTTINDPGHSDALSSIASDLTVTSAGETQIVRVDLSTTKLATLASEGRSWVLSIGDVLLNATEPVALIRSRDQGGRFEMTAMLGKPYKVHSFRDPVVGDLLDVVTAFPPSRGTARDLNYVDFDALRSVQGLVIRPDNEDLQVQVADDHALITAPNGLTLSDQSGPRSLDAGKATEFRDSYVDLAANKAVNPGVFQQRITALSTDAATKEGQARAVARLALAQYYVGNQFAEEALGVLKILGSEIKNDELIKKVNLTTAIANVLAARPVDAIAILNSPAFADESDAVMWRAMAQVDNHDFVDARSDALAAESVVTNYPVWVQQKFYLDGVRAALETNDIAMAQRYLGLVEFAQLSPDDVTLYQLFQARVAEAQGATQDALDAYGQVIAADVRPTRAEAVYRTLLVLQRTGKIDLNKATATLASESMLWRGDALEINMDKLLAELYFEHKDYRLGFETARQAATHSPESGPVGDLLNETDAQFSDLYLNGAADQMSDLDALSLYYDYRTLTPAGARGDEMIRNLARRLVKVNLLSQAGDLLQYQIDSRLTGVAQAQVAADLALIRIADRDPQSALRVLNKTRMSNLSPTLDRQRRVLEARALIDADRADLALDLLSAVKGRDADLLRVDGYWHGKNYSSASALLESMYTQGSGETLDQSGRFDLIKSAVGYVLAGDALGLERLRSKFSDSMSQSPAWPMFDYLTSANASTSGEDFKAAAKAVANIDSITGFLKAYRQAYPADQGIVPADATKKTAA